MNSLLTPQQKLALELISQTPLAKSFYFSGGTALSHYYLQHRFSEDLDFFCEDEFDPQEIAISLKQLKNKLGFKNFDYQSSFNRNLYFLKFPNNYVLKLEFTYYPFKPIETTLEKDGLLVDSAIDIAVNKLFTISQKPRGRDYFDLFHLIKKYDYQLKDLRMKAKLKFDWHIDPLQLASKLFEADQHLDDPIIVKKVKQKELTNFFQTQAKQMEGEVIE